MHTYVSIRYWSTTWSSWRHLGAFGAQKKCLKRSTDEQRTRATSPERRHEVAVTHIPERPCQSDVERSLAFLSQDTLARATCQSDVPRSLAFPWRDDTQQSPERRLQSDTARSLARRRPESDVFGATQPGRSRRNDPGATSRSDVPRSLRVYLFGEFMISQGPFGHFIMHVLHCQKPKLSTFVSHSRQKISFLENN